MLQNTKLANETAAPAIECERLVFRYRDGAIGSDGISLAIQRGELFALLGPNGAGKTTLVRQLCLDLRSQHGTVRIFGANAWDDPSVAKRHFGIIPQDAGLFGGLTVEEHVRCFARLKGISRAHVEVETTRVLRECGLDEVRRKNVKRLSGGQQRRVLVALALLGSPDILVLDEPTTGLDPLARRELWRTLRDKRATGTTIVLTSHYLEEVEALADRIGFIAQGKLLCLGTQSELAESLPYRVRVTHHAPAPTGSVEQRFATFGDAQTYIEQERIVDYAIRRVGLDDVYFHLMGTRFAAEG